MAKVVFAGLLMDLSAGWLDVTASRDSPSPPTLALDKGVGAFQFTVATYASGEKPLATPARLSEMFQEFFCDGLGLDIQPTSFSSPHVFGLGGNAVKETDFFAAWLVSNGEDFALVTYIAAAPIDMRGLRELESAERAVRSIEFSRG